MDTLWNILNQIGMMAGLSFVAALLLCLPGLFSKAALRRRRRLPLPGSDSDSDATGPKLPLPREPAGWRQILFRFIAAPFGAALFIIIIPAICAMMLAGVCASYRSYRHLAYRALRRKWSVLAFPLSFPVGLMFTVRARPHDAASAPRIA